MNITQRIARIGLPVAAVLTSIGIGFAGITSAQTATSSDSTSGASSSQTRPANGGLRGERPAVFGKVTAISGTTLTVANQKPNETTSTTYTVDASNAKVLKGSEGAAPTESTMSAIAVGDTVAIRGTVSGTTVTATEIMSGVMMHGKGGFGGRGHGTRGTVSAVNGNTITLTGANGQTYTVDASSATIGKVTTISVGDVQVGDSLDVMGEVSGTNVTAKRIMDGIPQNPQQ